MAQPRPSHNGAPEPQGGTSLRYICALYNPDTDPPPAKGARDHCYYADNEAGHARRDAFIRRWSGEKDTGVYYCIVLLQARKRNADNVTELGEIILDLDLKNIAQDRDTALRVLQGLALRPTEIRDSGFGLHAIWRLKEPATGADLDLAESIMHELVALLAGDPAPTHRAALLRVPGTFNTKEGGKRECRVIWSSNETHDITDFKEMFELYAARGPLLTLKPKSNGHDGPTEDKTGERIDYGARLRDAESGAEVNDRQPKRILSLLNRGEHPNDVFNIVLGETMGSRVGRALNYSEKREAVCIRARIGSALRKLNKEFEHGNGDVPGWLHSDFHDDYFRIIIDGGRPELIRQGHHFKVVDVKPKAKSSGAAPRAIPLTAEEWLQRKLPPFDCLMGDWLTTTSRIMFSADTGMGKSSFWLAVLAHCAAGTNFLHWRCHRPARVLFIDGEMSRLWLQKMVGDATRRLGMVPPTLFILSREDYAGLPPLNTAAGKAFLLAYIESIGGVDLIAFDNLMALLIGELKEPASWQNVLDLVAELSRRNIGQVWVNHTGHDASKSYGDKTRDWRMTSTIHLTKIEQPPIEVSFELKFGKARERTPLNREDFQTVKIAIVNDTWLCDVAIANQSPPRPGTVEAKCLDLLHTILNDDDGVVDHHGHRATAIEAWNTRCRRVGACTGTSEKSTQTMLNRMRLNLVNRNMIGCDNDLKLVWLL